MAFINIKLAFIITAIIAVMDCHSPLGPEFKALDGILDESLNFYSRKLRISMIYK